MPNKNKILYFSGVPVLLIVAFLCLPVIKFEDPTSTVIESSEGFLLGAKIADDEQWRFPERDTLPFKYITSVLQFEDEYFFKHPGINPISLTKAMFQNVKQKRIVSGGSTITMQVVRISRNGKERIIKQKLIEMILALRLELAKSKSEILCLYASHAPFGGNIVGLDAASWRYFGREPENLSWAESATLAVLPNAPSLIYPGKSNNILRSKRNKLLYKMYENKILDSLTYILACSESIPVKPKDLPQIAPHLLLRSMKENKGEKIRTTINYQLQNQTNTIVRQHNQFLKHNLIQNASVIILEVETGNIIAYIGNTDNPSKEHGNDVDIILAPRSSGSILKPFLFAFMLDDGELLQNMLIPDIPTQLGSYSPKNFNLRFNGAVPAKLALSRSLNVPAIRMLSDYGLTRFYTKLKEIGMNTLSYPAEHYGLSLILGGAECNLLEISTIYNTFSRVLLNYTKFNNHYSKDDWVPANYKFDQSINASSKSYTDENYLVSASAIWYTYNALIEVNRPENEWGWETFSNSENIAWKTGTSFGFRDAWAVGTNAKYTVGVWVGNADGEGRPGLTGSSVAAPILFDVFSILDKADWFLKPLDEIVKVPICKISGLRASQICPEVDTLEIPINGLKTEPCHYHKIIHLDETESYQVTSSCVNPMQMKHVPWFILPPVQEWYYKLYNPAYKSLPPFMKGCDESAGTKVMDFIYPKENNDIYIPLEIDGKRGKTIFEVAHRNENIKIHWHLDDQFIGTTQKFHQMEFFALPGIHSMTLVDENGGTVVKKFRIIEK